MIQKFLLLVSRLYTCHYQLGVNMAAICIDSPNEGYFSFLSGIHITYIPPFF